MPNLLSNAVFTIAFLWFCGSVIDGFKALSYKLDATSSPAPNNLMPWPAPVNEVFNAILKGSIEAPTFATSPATSATFPKVSVFASLLTRPAPFTVAVAPPVINIEASPSTEAGLFCSSLLKAFKLPYLFA